jgi:nucleotide-binding universal stress UspA family protein
VHRATTPSTAGATREAQYSSWLPEPGPVVVATSGRNGRDALRAASLLAPRLGAAVAVLSVLEPEPAYLMGPDVGPLPPELEDLRSAALREGVANQVRDVLGPGAAWPVELRYGEPGQAIATAARELRSPVIVMGIGRHDRVARLVGHEVVLRAIRHADRPVLAAADGFDALPRVAVAATDFSPASVAAVQAALPLLADGATLHLVHVWWRFDVELPALRARDEAYERSIPELFERARSALRASTDVTIKAVPLIGQVPGRILDYAAAHGADLLVAGKQGHRLLERLLIGSITSALVRAATCSVLIAPTPSVAETDRLQRHVTGTFQSRRPEEWAVQLDGFFRRNYRRRTALQVDDPQLGAQSQETGYALLGATYDPHDRRIELMLGDATGGTRHITRSIAGVTAVAVLSDAWDQDVALRVEHGDGQTLLTFPPS